jgi:hypothetical protein
MLHLKVIAKQSKQLEELVRPKPNSSFLGIRPNCFYNLAGTPKKERISPLVKTKVGEPPVLYSKVDLEYTTRVLENYAENNGYFNTKATLPDTAKKATATYTVIPKQRYTIRTVQFPQDSSLIANTIRETQERSLLKVNGYSLDAIEEKPH